MVFIFQIHRIPIHNIPHPILRQRLHHRRPRLCPRIRRRRPTGLFNAIIGQHALHLPLLLQIEIQPAIGIDIVILQIQTLQPRIVPTQILRLAKRIQQPLLRHPIHTVCQLHRIGLQSIERALPLIQHPIRLLVQTSQIALRQRQINALNINRRNRPPILPIQNPLMRWIARNLLQRPHRIAQRHHIPRKNLPLQQIQHHRSRANLQSRGILRHI